VAAFITADAQNVYLRVDVANAEVVQTPITSAPTGLDLLAVSDTGTSDTDNLTNDTTPTLSWNSVINADGYKISFDAGSNWQDV
jgi:hypothetical protein